MSELENKKEVTFDSVYPPSEDVVKALENVPTEDVMKIIEKVVAERLLSDSCIYDDLMEDPVEITVKMERKAVEHVYQQMIKTKAYGTFAHAVSGVIVDYKYWNDIKKEYAEKGLRHIDMFLPDDLYEDLRKFVVNFKGNGKNITMTGIIISALKSYLKRHEPPSLYIVQ